MLISASELTKFHNEKCILDHVSFSIEENNKIALIGVNGAGKSTFLKILADKETYEGKMIRKNGLRISFLAQEDDLEADHSILEEVRLKAVSAKEFEAKRILTRLKLNDFDKKIGTCSGGQKKRLSLAIALLRECDLLLLDEPTNHLDSEMIEWLEKYLIKMNRALLMVTHDRYFLERITDKIIEIDRTKIYEYQANYSAFLEMKKQREEQALANERKRDAFLRKELEWIRSNAQARSTKSRERIERFEKLSNMDKIKTVDNVEMIKMSSRLGKKTIEIKNLSMTRNHQELFKNFSYHLKRNDRIGIIGENGCGKTTLLNLIAGELTPDSGEIEIGETVKIGYFKQLNDAFDDKMIVRDAIASVSDDLVTSEGRMSAKMMLERFLFDSHLQYSRIGYLSGGEKRRLYLLSILMNAPNVLLLDEPTNDMDIATLNILEDYLDSYSGAVMVVSHDRYFLDRCCDYILAFENGTIGYYSGGYSDYYAKKQPPVEAVKENKTSYAEMKRQQRSARPHLSSKEKQELENMETVILTLENQIRDIDEAMNSCLDYEEISNLSDQRNKLEMLLEQKNERWMELLEIEEQMKMMKQ